MPWPRNEREAWTEELSALPTQIAEHQRQLDATSVGGIGARTSRGAFGGTRNGWLSFALD